MLIVTHSDATEHRTNALREYCERNVHDGRAMVCQHEAKCRASRTEPTYHFYAGQLSHVGRKYDLEIDGKPLRIVIVGQEYGHGHQLVSLDERSEMVADTSARLGFAGRNPHMRGTTSLLRLILGRELGTDGDGERLCDGHIFDGFALVNALLCTALDEPRGLKLGGGKGRSSGLMRQNCSTHFLKTLEILDPTVIVLQGQGVRQWVGSDLGIAPRGPVQSSGQVNGRVVPVLTFNHPSAGGTSAYWGNSIRSRYLLNIVRPAIAEWRKAWGVRCLQTDAS